MKKRYILAIWVLVLIISFFIDDYFLNFVIALRTPFLNEFMGWMSHIGSTIIVLIVITSLFLWEERKREWIPTLLVSVLVSVLLSNTLKYVFDRPRPDVLQLVKETNPSFPSNHATAAFSTIPVLDREFPLFKWFWVVFAVLVALSRIYLGVHYLSDVVAGSLLGYSISSLFVFLELKYKFFKKSIFKKSKK